MRGVLRFWPLGLLPLVATMALTLRFGKIVDLKITKAQSDLEALTTALGAYEGTYGDFPSEAEGLAALTRDARFLSRISQDPWGNSYLYHHVAGNKSYVVYSPGLDHRDDAGAGDDVIVGRKDYRCADYGVNCPMSAGQIAGWGSLALAVVSLAGGIALGITDLVRPRKQ